MARSPLRARQVNGRGGEATEAQTRLLAIINDFGDGTPVNIGPIGFTEDPLSDAEQPQHQVHQPQPKGDLLDSRPPVVGLYNLCHENRHSWMEQLVTKPGAVPERVNDRVEDKILFVLHGLI